MSVLISYDIASITAGDKENKVLSYLAQNNAKLLCKSTYMITTEGKTAEEVFSELSKIIDVKKDCLVVLDYNMKSLKSEPTERNTKTKLVDPLANTKK